MFSFPYDGNQPTTTELFEKFQNPSSSSISLPHDDHHILHHNNYSQQSDLQGQLAPNFLEHDGLLLSYLLSHQQPLVGNSTTTTTASNEISAAGSNSLNADVVDHEIVPEAPKASTKKAAKAPRRRLSGKKDRHSKICTAQGPRDRRMRLSLQIARKFFDLQDMLGFDKASKTIEWLFTKSKTAIQDLKHHFNYNTSPSAAAVAELGDYGSTNNNANAKIISSSNTNSESTTSEVVYKTTSMKKNRKMCVVAKESRDEARARARERMREKTMRSQGLFDCPINNDNGHQLFETAGMVGRCSTSSGGGARSFLNSEDCDFVGIHENWGGGIINNDKNVITGSALSGSGATFSFIFFAKFCTGIWLRPDHVLILVSFYFVIYTMAFQPTPYNGKRLCCCCIYTMAFIHLVRKMSFKGWFKLLCWYCILGTG